MNVLIWKKNISEIFSFENNYFRLLRLIMIS